MVNAMVLVSRNREQKNIGDRKFFSSGSADGSSISDTVACLLTRWNRVLKHMTRASKMSKTVNRRKTVKRVPYAIVEVFF